MSLLLALGEGRSTMLEVNRHTREASAPEPFPATRPCQGEPVRFLTTDASLARPTRRPYAVSSVPSE